MSWLERMLGGHHGGQSQGGHGRGHGRGHGGSHGESRGHHGDRYERGGHYVDDGYRYPSEEWGRAPASMPPPRAGAVCPKCNAGNAEGARFCGQCATSLMPQACAQCNQTLAQGAKFCSQCGTPAKP